MWTTQRPPPHARRIGSPGGSLARRHAIAVVMAVLDTCTREAFPAQSPPTRCRISHEALVPHRRVGSPSGATARACRLPCIATSALGTDPGSANQPARRWRQADPGTSVLPYSPSDRPAPCARMPRRGRTSGGIVFIRFARCRRHVVPQGCYDGALEHVPWSALRPSTRYQALPASARHRPPSVAVRRAAPLLETSPSDVGTVSRETNTVTAAAASAVQRRPPGSLV
jgi:hypothetical protein